jgi:hypothetical protein
LPKHSGQDEYPWSRLLSYKSTTEVQLH